MKRFLAIFALGAYIMSGISFPSTTLAAPHNKPAYRQEQRRHTVHRHERKSRDIVHHKHDRKIHRDYRKYDYRRHDRHGPHKFSRHPRIVRHPRYHHHHMYRGIPYYSGWYCLYLDGRYRTLHSDDWIAHIGLPLFAHLINSGRGYEVVYENGGWFRY